MNEIQLCGACGETVKKGVLVGDTVMCEDCADEYAASVEATNEPETI